MKKVFLKRTADALEKLAIAGIAIGIFQGHNLGMWLGAVFMVMSYYVTYRETKS